jgi:hypothetical protein
MAATECPSDFPAQPPPCATAREWFWVPRFPSYANRLSGVTSSRKPDERGQCPKPGEEAWENVVWSAKAVNQRKADRLPPEAGLKLLAAPRATKELPATALHLSNAFKFTREKEKATVEVGWHELEGETTYFARDNGAGFNMRHAQRLFS